MIVELDSKRKRDEFMKKRDKIEFKNQNIYINENLMTFN